MLVAKLFKGVLFERHHILLFIITAIIFGFNPVLQAKVALSAQCAFKPSNSDKIEGVRTSQRYKIASLSKIFTSYWAIAKLGPDFRFQTKIHIVDPEDANLSKQGYKDVHIEGGMSPYFSLKSLQFLVAELNSKTVYKINVLTFDEKFKYATKISDNASLTSAGMQITSSSTLRDLSRDIKQINQSYALTKKQVKTATGLDMPSTLKLSVRSVTNLESKNFSAPTETTSFVLRSAPLKTILKEMNRNSHNSTADSIFEYLGGSEAFHKFMKQRLDHDLSDIMFVNGSGYPLRGIYNEATCETIVRSINDLNEILEKKYSLNLENILSVAGADFDPKRKSVVTNIYNSKNMSHALVAKTGTLRTTIALGGAIETEDGTVFFSSIQSISSFRSDADRQGAYAQIRSYLSKIIESNKGVKVLDYEAQPFSSFDGKSKLLELPSNSSPNGLKISGKS